MTPGIEPRGNRQARTRLSRRWRLVLDWALAVAGLAVATWQLAPSILAVESVGGEFGQLETGWLVAAAGLSLGALLAYGELTRQFLAVGAAEVSGATVQAVAVAGNAMSLTVPAAGGAVGAAYTVYALRERGVSLALSAWATGMAELLTGTILVVLAPLGFVAGRLLDPAVGLGLSALLAVLSITAWLLVRRRTVLVPTARWLMALARRVPVLGERVTTSPAQAACRLSNWLSEQNLSPKQWALALLTALATWVLDYLALVACLGATAQAVPWQAAALGYLAVQASIMANLTPGGTGPAEAGLLAALVAGGMPAGPAAIAVVLYRGASWIAPSLLGWLVFLALASGKKIDSVEEPGRFGTRAAHALGLVSLARSMGRTHYFRTRIKRPRAHRRN